MRVQLEASSARLASPEDSSPFPSVLSFPVSLFVTRKENLSPVSPVRGWRKTASPGGVRDAEWAPVAVSSLRPNPPRSQAPLKPTRGKAVPKPLISTYVHKYEVSYAGVVDAAATIYGDTERESGTLGQSTPFGHLARSVETKATVPPCAARGAPLRPKIGLPYQLYVSAPRAKNFGSLGWPVGCQAAPGLCHCAPPPSRHRWQPHGPFATLSSNSY